MTDSPTARSWRYGEVGRLVDNRVNFLQESRQSSATVAQLAYLRANVGRPPGADPAIWSLTVEGVPGNPHNDEPTAEEWAVHQALTLFASHQQSRDKNMHEKKTGLGQAVARLDRRRGRSDDNQVSPVRRRFDAAVTSATPDELSYHLRGLVALLRGEEIGLDYGLLADDLVQFQRIGGASTVRRRWARQYYFPEPKSSENDTAETTAEESS
ncbi:MAG: type I-E CRISPR-associated protein Cse2/CasB [Propionibacteriaceae bacterium]|nr:type I-E CRISPR-associated protein Cse2/CasB [Propionibacteriaceae bacterium]